MLSKRHVCQLLQEQPLVHDELELELLPLESVREQELQQQRELVQELELELPPLESVHDHHGQPANQLHEHRLQQEYHWGKLFSASSVCSVR